MKANVKEKADGLRPEPLKHVAASLPILPAKPVVPAASILL